MKKINSDGMRNFSFYVFFIILILGAIPYCSADSKFHSTISLDVHEDYTYDLLITRNFDTNYYGTENWTMGLGNSLNKIRIYDDKGDVKILNIYESEDYIDYNFDTNYHYGEGYKPIYFSSNGNQLTEINDYLYRAEFTMGSYGPNEEISINVSLPKSIDLISSRGYNRMDFDYRKRNLNFDYDDSDGNYRLTFIKSAGTANFSEINYDNKIFFVEKNSLLEDAVNKILNYTPFVLNYPKWENDFVIFAISNLSALNVSWAGGLYEYDGLILIDESKFPLDYSSFVHTDANILLTSLHEFTHYSNSFLIDSSYPKWLEEGSAVYSEIKYIEEHENDSNINSLLSTVKISMAGLEEWYSANRTIESFYENHSEDYFSYPVYGFLANHYAKSYGEDKFLRSLVQIRKEKISMDNLSDIELEELTIKTLIRNSGYNLTEKDIFFPDKKLFLENKTAFEDKMKDFTFQNPSGGDNALIWAALIGIIFIIFIIMIIIGIPVLILVLIIRKIRRSKGHVQKAGKK